jgi:pyruvate dehydrogenase E2 component (dihydrolipoamide acetyltransferase)
MLSVGSRTSPDLKLKASPRARAPAAFSGLSLVGIEGSGPAGRIMERNVKTAMAGRALRAVPAQVTARSDVRSGATRELQLEGAVRSLADRSTTLAGLRVHSTMTSFADASEIKALAGKLMESPPELRLREITVDDMVLYAVSRAAASPRLKCSVQWPKRRRTAP